jgi:hypothetical protein
VAGVADEVADIATDVATTEHAQPAGPATYWVMPDDHADDRTKLVRRVTWPMRALSAGLWIVAVSSVLIGPPR